MNGLSTRVCKSVWRDTWPLEHEYDRPCHVGGRHTWVTAENRCCWATVIKTDVSMSPAEFSGNIINFSGSFHINVGSQIL
jgi:hypothetical protein